MSELTRHTKLTKLFQEFYRPLKLRGGSSKTDGLYALYIGHFSSFLVREAAIADFSDDTLARYAAHRRSLGRAPETVNGELGKLRALWNFSCRRGVVQLWPTLEDEPEPVRVPMAWMKDDLQRLFEACRVATGWVGEVPACHFWTALALCLWDTGERIGALLQVEWDHLEDSAGWLKIPAQFRKGRRKERIYHLHQDTLRAVRKLRRADQPKIFAWELDRGYLWRRWKKVHKDAGLPTDRRSSFHRMRRSHASWAEACGLNATELLGHESRRTTLSYLDPRITSQKNPTDVLFRPGTAPEGI